MERLDPKAELGRRLAERFASFWSPLLHRLSHAERVAVLQLFELWRFDHGETIYPFARARPPAIHVVLNGEVVLQRDASQRPARPVVALGPGDSFGEAALAAEEPFVADGARAD